ncbi:MAG: hypothetical protein U5K33_08510 [Halofilum sp. (in: g-proteobacteria)]|nr:hypothetical protein [Halofilum sp. (in: g-proteobacteria)]
MTLETGEHGEVDHPAGTDQCEHLPHRQRARHLLDQHVLQGEAQHGADHEQASAQVAHGLDAPGE